MSPIYDQISANRRRTVILVTVFVLLIGLLGWIYGEYSGFGLTATVIAVAFALVFSVGSYWAGDSVALWSAGAKGPLEKKDAPELFRLVENLSIAAGLTMPKIYLMPDPGINAFATGRDPAHASVAVTAGALQKLEKTELEGILAHELSHVRNYDIRYMLLVTVLVGALVILAAGLRHTFFFGGGRRNDREGGGNGILLLVGLLMAILAPIFAELIRLAVSREREYLADASGALLTRYPAGLAGALEKIKRGNQPLDHASEGTAHLYFANPFGNLNSRVSNLFSTHPPIEERIKRLREMGSQV